MVKKILKPILIIILAIIVLFAAYVAYVLISYHRIEDNFALEIEGEADLSELETQKQYRISSANIGFGAYSDDYSFFMDGGTESWAYSKDAVNENISGSTASVLSLSPDIMLFQEVDLDSTRSYHVNEKDLIVNALKNANYDKVSSTFAVNYDSPFLLYPLTQPHGKSKAGLLTISSATIQDSVRRSLPIEEGMSKLIDLDRCYSKNYINLNNGKQLVLYNVHLSAYTTDPSTATNQVVMLNEDMLEELNKGNYIIAGGDMNKDVLGDSSKYFGTSSTENWAQPIPDGLLDDNFTIIGPIDESNPVPSCRNADSPYTEDSFVLTIDGFIVSSNIDVIDANVLDTGFKYSDHNPVYMDFVLK
ncbi:endonuclease/exonuclease/phosphatase family protein [Pseudobutyrivibrio ruminis]|uniref:endonuclease/exonuclease/phosphatase family protein n=1 Tax=Pseudobutyrivibrio ruminis TaxID=46206 RepID=UPI00041F1618|nr:endonuclease/exonuclease/phosphatase family protein [Pseudobutyrivibrio ruminis]